jgi:hypothetical protein
VSPVHSRMPALLSRDAVRAWLARPDPTLPAHSRRALRKAAPGLAATRRRATAYLNMDRQCRRASLTPRVTSPLASNTIRPLPLARPRGAWGTSRLGSACRVRLPVGPPEAGGRSSHASELPGAPLDPAISSRTDPDETLKLISLRGASAMPWEAAPPVISSQLLN